MLKVMMALPELDVGGAQTLTISLIRALRKIDEEIRVQVLVLEKPHGSYLEELCRQEGIDVVYLGKDKGLHLGIIPKITKAIRTFAPDVIHMHKSRMHYFMLPILFSRLRTDIYRPFFGRARHQKQVATKADVFCVSPLPCSAGCNIRYLQGFRGETLSFRARFRSLYL